MLSVHCIPLWKNLYSEIFAEKNQNNVYVFPTSSAKTDFIRLHQSRWQLQKTGYFTMSEIKEKMTCRKLPQLHHEMRRILLYSAISSEQKELLALGSYFQSRLFLKKLLDLWEEMSEELIDNDYVKSKIFANELSSERQLDIWQTVAEIKIAYQNIVIEKGYSDFIDSSSESFDFNFLEAYSKIIFVNQFYYTAREKKIINELKKIKDVDIYFHLSENFIDKDKLQISRDIDFTPLLRCSNLKMHFFAGETDQLSMISSMLEHSNKNKINFIIDFHLNRQNYLPFLNRNHLLFNDHLTANNTIIWGILSHYNQIIQNTLHDNSNDILLPLFELREFLTEKRFRFVVGVDEGELFEETIQQLNKLIENDFIFLDKNHQILSGKIIPEIKKQILQFSNMKNIGQFCSVVNQIIDSYLQNSLTKSIDIVETFANILSEFETLERNLSISKWGNDLFQNQKKNEFGPTILKLFLIFCAEKEIKVDQKNTDFEQTKILSLQETRNLPLSRICIANLTEKTLPGSPKQPFLFSENQRKVLGLKTYHDINQRDKYYLLRLLATSEEAYLFSFSQRDNDIEVSSFIEELLMVMQEKISVNSIDNLSFSGLMNNMLNLNQHKLCPDSIDEETFLIPVIPDIDFPCHTISLSATSHYLLRESPFEYCLREKMKLVPAITEKRIDFSESYLGNFIHEVFRQVWKAYHHRYKNKLKTDFFINNPTGKILDEILREATNSKDFKLRNAGGFSERYFQRFFIPIIEQSIKHFLVCISEIFNRNDYIFVQPEIKHDNIFMSEITYENVIYNIILRGIIDLEIKDEDNIYIFDYKTGSDSPSKKRKYEHQLFFYNLIYTLQNLPSAEGLFIYFTERQKLENFLNRPSAKTDLKKEICSELSIILEEGYKLPLKKYIYEDKDISRRDLLRSGSANIGEEDDE
ncbi:MAG: PD-(D/E)XK nuclease family protein [Candidatus Cloacimonetes bacterium]|nr:PD-(D/E)XK nuclease family protein [Candidatus Cloacimonadota bacterium]